MERRSGVTGNAETATHAPDMSRESNVTEAVTRVEGKQRKKERAIALFHLLTVEDQPHSSP